MVRRQNWIAGSQPFRIVGPFAGGANLRGFDRVHEPERSRAPAYSGKHGSVSWKDASVAAGDVLDFHRFWPNEEYVVAYAAAVIHSSKAQRVTFRLGSDDGEKVRLNGRLVHSRRVDRAHRSGNDQVTVDLKSGANELLMKVDQGNGAWQLSLDATDGNGWPADVQWKR